MTNLMFVDWSQIPAPEDDGLAEHLVGTELPSIILLGTNGEGVDLSSKLGIVVVYAYPMTGQPDVPLPNGWDIIPGARGCTPQSCAFRDHFVELRDEGVNHVFGLSTQDTGYQAEAASRLHLPFPLLSDSKMELARSLGLPIFETAGLTLLKRLTMVIANGRIVKIFYPVFPPDRSPMDVIEWFRSQRGKG